MFVTKFLHSFARIDQHVFGCADYESKIAGKVETFSGKHKHALLRCQAVVKDGKRK